MFSYFLFKIGTLLAIYSLSVVAIERIQDDHISNSFVKAIHDCRMSLNSNLSNATFVGCLMCRTSSHYSRLLTEENIILRSPGRKEIQRQAISENEKFFTNVYSKKLWTAEGGGSGTGSDPVKAFTAGYIIELLVYKFMIVKLLDAPCGAASDSWIRYALSRIRDGVPCFNYHGVDVVATVIEKNSNTFRNDWMKFSQADLSLSTSSLPSGYDMILSRDALQHLPYKDIAGVLSNYCKSGATYLLVGSYLDVKDANRDLTASDMAQGGCFAINLLQSPFLFPQPLQVYAEKGGMSGTPNEEHVKFLLFYKLSQICKSRNFLRFVQTQLTDPRKRETMS